MKREQHIRRLVDYARQGKAKAIMIGAGSIFLTSMLLRTVDLSQPLLIGLGFLGVAPLLVREWKLGTIRSTFNDDATYQRLIRFPFWLTLFGLLVLYALLGWFETGSPGTSFFLALGVLLLGMFGLQRAFDRVILKLEPDYITDRELHRELN
ncbi:hypothetical protein EVJ29_00040 [Exiguobacterium sp. SH4S7]|uniref:hypothetical protein n=1 Tax=Exiguobacterium sp. SH4S7 TaxID=2510958 RepID=UPI0010390502|nr:hypothetical protein [Exiguobacterium sp. SH4S7]TCI39065.1 hypothetical protein EVJ29_00040 [Exiguobacterium sp. SH4S7]